MRKPSGVALLTRGPGAKPAAQRPGRQGATSCLSTRLSTPGGSATDEKGVGVGRVERAPPAQSRGCIRQGRCSSTTPLPRSACGHHMAVTPRAPRPGRSSQAHSYGSETTRGWMEVRPCGLLQEERRSKAMFKQLGERQEVPAPVSVVRRGGQPGAIPADRPTLNAPRWK